MGNKQDEQYEDGNRICRVSGLEQERSGSRLLPTYVYEFFDDGDRSSLKQVYIPVLRQLEEILGSGVPQGSGDSLRGDLCDFVKCALELNDIFDTGRESDRAVIAKASAVKDMIELETQVALNAYDKLHTLADGDQYKEILVGSLLSAAIQLGCRLQQLDVLASGVDKSVMSLSAGQQRGRTKAQSMAAKTHKHFEEAMRQLREEMADFETMKATSQNKLIAKRAEQNAQRRGAVLTARSYKSVEKWRAGRSGV